MSACLSVTTSERRPGTCTERLNLVLKRIFSFYCLFMLSKFDLFDILSNLNRHK